MGETFCDSHTYIPLFPLKIKKDEVSDIVNGYHICDLDIVYLYEYKYRAPKSMNWNPLLEVSLYIDSLRDTLLNFYIFN